MNKKEIWKSLIDHTGYEISSIGRVRSVDRVLTQKNRWGVVSKFNKKGKIISNTLAGHGYPSCYLGRSRRDYIHRLVAITFIGPPPDGKNQVNHKNLKKTDNRVCNLEWVTHKENMAHASTGGVFNERSKRFSIERRGENSPVAKLTEKEVLKIYDLCHNSNHSVTQIVKMFKTSKSNVYGIRRKERWKHLFKAA